MAVVYAATSDIGRGCNTVFLQDVAEACGLPLRCIANGECSTENAPDSGTTSGSRQTVVTGEAVRGAAFLLRDAMLDIEAGKHAPDAPVSAHGDGVKIEYDDGRAYQLHTQELVAGRVCILKIPLPPSRRSRAASLGTCTGADRQAGSRRSQPQEPHLLRFCHACGHSG